MLQQKEIFIIIIAIIYLIGFGYTIQNRMSSTHNKGGVEPYYISLITFILSPVLILIKIGVDISILNDKNYSLTLKNKKQ
jgi:hypothetical protein